MPMYLILWIGFILSLGILNKTSRHFSDGLASFFLVYFLLFVGIVIPSGYLLSYFNAIGNPLAWAFVLPALAGCFWIIAAKIYPSNTTLNVFYSLKNGLAECYTAWNSLKTFEKIIFGTLVFAFLATSIINLVVLIMTFPNEWDSMTGHLVKCALYIQNGNMDRVQGTTWSIDYYPNSLPTLQILGFHLFGEKGFKLIHYLSYWVFVISTYGISGSFASEKKGRFLATLLAALLPSALIQAVSTETDMVQSAYLGLVVWLLLEVYQKPSNAKLFLLTLASGIWISHKVTFLLIGPAIFVLVFFIFFKQVFFRTKILKTSILLGLFIIIYVIPNGYLANIQAAEKFKIGALSAPEQVMQWHGIEHYSSTDKVKNLALNVVRYTSDFLHLDGLRNIELGNAINQSFRHLPNKFFLKFHPERNQYWVVASFEIMGNKNYQFYKERPYWGIISFLVVLPIFSLLILNLMVMRKWGHGPLVLVFMLAAVFHFLSLCYSAPYDPIKGRYFMNMAVWCLPLLVFLPQFKVYYKLFTVLSFIIALSAIFTLTHRKLYPLVGQNNIFTISRDEQLVITRPELHPAYAKFNELVPQDAIVALGTQQEKEDYEYPLWGPAFKRKLIQIHPFRSPIKPIPAEAQYLFYSEGVVAFQNGDIKLNDGDIANDTSVPESTFYLRKLR